MPPASAVSVRIARAVSGAGRLILRRFTEDDVENLVGWTNPK